MKKLLLVSTLFVGMFAASAQSLERFVIASSGDYFPVGSINISFTVGELAAVESFLANPLMHLTQGFQQPDTWFKGIAPVISKTGFGVFPNPAKDKAVVRYEGTSDGKLHLSMYNVLGQRVTDMDINPQMGSNDYIIDISSFGQGLYMIELSGKRGGVEFRELEKLNVIN